MVTWKDGSDVTEHRLALLEVWGLIPSTNVVAHTGYKFQFHGLSCPLLTSVGTKHVCGMYMQAKPIFKHMRQWGLLFFKALDIVDKELPGQSVAGKWK